MKNLKIFVYIASCCACGYMLSKAYEPLTSLDPDLIDTEHLRSVARSNTVDLLTGKMRPVRNVYILAEKKVKVGGTVSQEYLFIESVACLPQSSGARDEWILVHVNYLDGKWRRYMVYDAEFGFGICSYLKKPSIHEILENRLFWSFNDADMLSLKIIPSEWDSVFGRAPRKMDILLERIRRNVRMMSAGNQ